MHLLAQHLLLSVSDGPPRLSQQGNKQRNTTQPRTGDESSLCGPHISPAALAPLTEVTQTFALPLRLLSAGSMYTALFSSNIVR